MNLSGMFGRYAEHTHISHFRDQPRYNQQRKINELALENYYTEDGKFTLLTPAIVIVLVVLRISRLLIILNERQNIIIILYVYGMFNFSSERAFCIYIFFLN